MNRGFRRVAAIACAAGAAACTAIVGDFPLGNVRPMTPIEPPDGGSLGPEDGEAPNDVADAGKSDGEGGDEPPIAETYFALADTGNWQAFDIKARFGGGTFDSAGFDGRYVYYLPYFSTAIVRFDTRAPGGFADAGAWSVYDLSAYTSGSLRGAAFDGRYLYFAPNVPSSTTGVANAIRFDTTRPLTDPGAYQTYDLHPADPHATAYNGGAAFDGRYLFLKTNDTFTTFRYDTTSSDFASASAWEVTMPSFLGANGGGQVGAHLHGSHVYFSGAIGANVRLDTALGFSDPSAWVAFTPGGLDDGGFPNTRGFAGACSDDRYVYFVPYYDARAQTIESVVLRYDSQAIFNDPKAYATFDTATLRDAGGTAHGFWGGVYDGRFLYLVPSAHPPVLARYDTTAPFEAPASWETLDLSTLPGVDPNETYQGGAFDGEYVYLVPSTAGTAVRFHAKTPASIPSTYRGSFF